jgi:hypothetical protein
LNDGRGSATRRVTMSRRRKRLVLPLSALVLLIGLGAGGKREEGMPSTMLLAPTLRETQSSIEKLEAFVADADATALALFRVHNRFGEHRRSFEGTPNCKQAWLVDLASRARFLGADLRDRVQSARAQRVRLDRMMLAATVEPLVDAETRFRTRKIIERVELLERRYLESVNWHSGYVERVARKCPTELQTSSGFAGAGLPPAEGEVSEDDTVPADTVFGKKVRRPTAVIAEGGGVICPGEIPAKGVVVLSKPSACWAPLRCDCNAVPVLPGAVIGRGVREAEPDTPDRDQAP